MKPAKITIAEAKARVNEVVSLIDSGSPKEAVEERNQLLLDALHTIAEAPAMADKLELKRLAKVALTSHYVLED